MNATIARGGHYNLPVQMPSTIHCGTRNVVRNAPSTSWIPWPHSEDPQGDKFCSTQHISRSWGSRGRDLFVDFCGLRSQPVATVHNRSKWIESTSLICQFSLSRSAFGAALFILLGEVHFRHGVFAGVCWYCSGNVVVVMLWWWCFCEVFSWTCWGRVVEKLWKSVAEKCWQRVL